MKKKKTSVHEVEVVRGTTNEEHCLSFGTGDRTTNEEHYLRKALFLLQKMINEEDMEGNYEFVTLESS